MEGVKWEGREERGSEGERCGEHLPVVMVHSLSLWPLRSALKMQDGERKRESESEREREGEEEGGGVLAERIGTNLPSFSSATFITSQSPSLLPPV